MSADATTYTVQIHVEQDGYWAEVQELPGCFASGESIEELREALAEAMSLYLSEPGKPVKVALGRPEPFEVKTVVELIAC
ncbi:type II toxin-antitoxin system HicB family antitoxin [Thermopolyspora sp. NPDC052614]|uniref:type II toxin-antitoxin system HicB family antitoxin n=1 Tax=Thermopolyspora sp. NPDC052614 TaxID=3155682 RepID=UPI0034455620